MARTESISIRVHPDNEQSQINLMQKFYWNLLSSQEIKTVDSSLERRGDEIYSVTKSETYIKLVFQRNLDISNLDKVKNLEKEYFSLKYIHGLPTFTIPIISIVIGIGLLVSLIAGLAGFGLEMLLFAGVMLIFLGGGIFWLLKIIQKRKQLIATHFSNEKKREEILSKLENILSNED